jgi:hypothetical protein
MEIGRSYAYRETRGQHVPMIKVKLLDKVGRKGKIKIRFEDGAHPGLEEYISTRREISRLRVLVSRAAYELKEAGKDHKSRALLRALDGY